jgi:hypothetical protein
MPSLAGHWSTDARLIWYSEPVTNGFELVVLYYPEELVSTQLSPNTYFHLSPIHEPMVGNNL